MLYLSSCIAFAQVVLEECFLQVLTKRAIFFFCHKIRATHSAKKKSGEVRGNGGCEGQLKDCFLSPCFKKLTFFVLQNMKSFK